MTAEIAIMNRGAVTLASDSATTIQVRGATKIYTSADKIFELTTTCPIGIMIYNNLEFMGLPFEVAIKHFRDANVATDFKSVEETATAFFKYLQDQIPPSKELQNEHVAKLLWAVYDDVRDAFQDKAGEEWRRSRGNTRRVNFSQLFTSTVTEEIEEYNKFKINDSLREFSVEAIIELYKEAIDQQIKRIFGEMPIDNAQKTLLRSLAIEVLRRDKFSDLFTGLVFAGFGSDELFPSLRSFEIDGMIDGKLKCTQSHTLDMSRNELGAEILPFAQREMADRFLDGVDPEFEGAIASYIENVVRATGTELIDDVPRLSKKNKRVLFDKLESAIGIVDQHLRQQGIIEIKAKFRQQIEDMVLFMPKPEMASLAEAMVNLTSVKRKYSAEEESVGGPIDVAVISKSEGFVWVKRKHYFEAKLNPRYFSRKFGTTGV